MSVSSITRAFSNHAHQVTGGSSAGGGQSSAAAALQEAMETKAQTAKEARNGDRVAIKRLQRLNQQQQQQQSDTPVAPSETAKGKQVNTKA